MIKICSSFEKMSAQQKLCDTCGINFEKMSKFAFNEHMLKHKEKTHHFLHCIQVFIYIGVVPALLCKNLPNIRGGSKVVLNLLGSQVG